MSDRTDLDRRRSLPVNHVFEAHNAHDPSADYLAAHRTLNDGAVMIYFAMECRDGSSRISRFIDLAPDQCEQFGRALIAAAEFCRANFDPNYVDPEDLDGED